MNERIKTGNENIDHLINGPKEPNRFVKGCRSLKDNYFLFSSDMADKLSDEDEITKVYRANASGGLLAMGIAATLYPVVPLGTLAAIILTYTGGKGLYNASRVRDKYMEVCEGEKIDKNSKLYKFGQELKRFTEGIF